MKKKTVCCSDLGAYINELLKRAKLKNEYVCETLGMGHDVLNGPTIRFVQEKPFFCIARCLFAYFVSL